MLSIHLLAALLIASVTGVPSAVHTLGILQEVEECKETHCEVELAGGEKMYIVKGENGVDPNDPCTTYHCQDDLLVVLNYKVCAKMEVCSADGKAPYTMPGDCCNKCEYLKNITDGRRLLNRSSDSSSTRPDTWGDWTPWTACSRECESGRQSRMRDCIQKGMAVINCYGERIQIRECNTHKCPIHGGWTDWTQWTQCSLTCDFGTQIRNRSCTNPVPMFGGEDCEGDAQETKTCHLRHCPIDCKWKEWTKWSECSADCGSGEQSRIRGMLVEKYGGQPCEGSAINIRFCNTHFCPIHGGWTEWSDWTQCSASCGNGTELRNHFCTNPVPQHGGQNCAGPSSQVQECFLRHCPVHCQWLQFSEWSACSLSCDNGTQHRSRDYVEAMHGGEECIGDLREIMFCNLHPCPDPCKDNGHPCFNQNITCMKITDTEFECGACPRGLRGNGRGPNGCEYVDECFEASPCFSGDLCHDLLEGYECNSCSPGFHGKGLRGFDIHDAHSLLQICTDVDECVLTSNGGCSIFRECENTLGSYICGPCSVGYVEDGPTGCKFSDPCAAGVHNCQKVEFCNNHAIGEFSCYCPYPLIGNGLECSNDTDLDGIPDSELNIGCDETVQSCLMDNCPFISNAKQEDTDNDGIGNFCDDDADNDGVKDKIDNCKFVANKRQLDSDYDGLGNKCDNCPIIFNEDQMDTDWDGIGDECDSDRDGDGIVNTADNCPIHSNTLQNDTDFDLWGDACDNCKDRRNTLQRDDDQDGVGNVCDTDVDLDNDGVQQDRDNCLGLANSNQLDTDGDGKGDPCDDDDDDDAIDDNVDNCPLVSNPSQRDVNGNGIGDACEMDSNDDGILDQIDSDGDKVFDAVDNDPFNKYMHKSGFTKSMEVSLTTGAQIKPKWEILSNGSEVRQMSNSGPGLLVGYDIFSSLEYNGTFFVDTKRDDDYIGLVFNYQSNRQFMLVSWKQRSQRYWRRPRPYGKAGIQIQVVHSKTGPGKLLTNAIWNSEPTINQVDMLYHDPKNRGWKDRKPYTWNIRYSSITARMTLRIYDETGLFVDSGCICDNQIKGGRLGLYVFSQEKVNFSNIKYGSLSMKEEASLAVQKCKNN